jgi:hypothetical protein
MERLIAVLLMAFAMAGARTAGAEPVTNLEPLTLLENGQIAGCGLSATGSEAEGSAIAEVIAFRDGNETAFAVRARSGPNSASTNAQSIRLVTATHDTAVLFPRPRRIAGGIVETRRVLQGFTGPSFAQELMVTGGRFEITGADGAVLALDLPRPMPHRVRQAYLTCAGDLFRPEPE